MNYSVDVNYYKDGYDLNKIDCVHAPIAAIMGHYNYDEYFDYCFLHALLCQDKEYNTSHICKNVNKIANDMGYDFKEVDYSNKSKDEIMNLIIDVLSKDSPVLLVVMYNSLFYNQYYKSESYKSEHGILITDYYSENNLFKIREQTLCRDVFIEYENSDLFLPMQLTSDMIYDIIINSNKQFIEKDAEYANKFFYIEKEENKRPVSREKIFHLALSYLKDWENYLPNIINSFNDNNVYDDIYVDYHINYIGSLKIIYSFIKDLVDEDSVSYRKLSVLEKKHIEVRKNAIKTLTMKSMAGEYLSESEVDDLISSVNLMDRRMIRLFQSLQIIDETEDEKESTFVSIKDYYNNQAFAKSFEEPSNANITGEGTFFIFNKVKANQRWFNMGYNFWYEYEQDFNDNISCDGQIIEVNHVKASNILILGCAEYGSYQEEIIINYENGRSNAVLADFSDFYQSSIYNEFLFWSGMAAGRDNSGTFMNNFSSRLFAKKYNIAGDIVVSIELPKRKNVHIFGITLEY